MVMRFANPKKRSFQNMLALDKYRLHDPLTGEYLHLSGTGTTRDVTWSWLGFMYQAQTLHDRAEIRGESWPFVLRHRDDFDNGS